MTWQQFKQAWLIKFWSPVPAVIAAGILSTYYFGITGTFWAVTGEFTRWGGHVLQLFGLHPEDWGYFKVIGLKGGPLDRISELTEVIGQLGPNLLAMQETVHELAETVDLLNQTVAPLGGLAERLPKRLTRPPKGSGGNGHGDAAPADTNGYPRA